MEIERKSVSICITGTSWEEGIQSVLFWQRFVLGFGGTGYKVHKRICDTRLSARNLHINLCAFFDFGCRMRYELETNVFLRGAVLGARSNGG